MFRSFITIIGCSLLLTSVSYAKVVPIYGSINDTILETGAGADPVLKISPAVACTVSIVAGCIEEEPERYFAVTDNNGKFSAAINLPQTCTYQSYYITVACTTSGNMNLFRSILVPKDSLVNEIRVDLTRQREYVTRKLPDSSYIRSLSFIRPPSIKSGDTLLVTARTIAIVDNNDTIPYPRCGGFIEITTSSGSVVQEMSVGCNYPTFTFLPQKNSYFEDQFTIVIPANLQQHHPDFRADRTLKVSYSVLGNGPKMEQYSFTVLDSTVKVVDLTDIQTVHTNKSIGNSAKMSINSGSVSLDIQQPGVYSVALFTTDGRLISTLARNHYFGSGNHTFAMTGTPSSRMVIARVISDDAKVSYQVKGMICR